MNKIWLPFKTIADFLVRFRFIIAAIAFIFILIFKLNGSSINIWDNLVTEYEPGKQQQVLFGEARTIRSDEWKVQTPFYLSQTYNDLKVENELLSPNGQNMILSYNSPVKDITMIGKPFNWGFLFFGKERAISWYWGIKLILMLLLAFEVSMILTRRNKYISALGSFWITFTPGVQWWFMQHGGDLVFFTLALMVATYHFFKHKEMKWKVAMSVLTAISIIGFVLVIYPAMQVPLLYFLVFWFVGLLVLFKENLRKTDILYVAGALASSGVVLLHFYLISKDSLERVLNTVYPGHRISLGGELKIADLFLPLSNWKFPSVDPNFSNPPEMAFAFSFYPIILFFAWKLFEKKRIKENILAFAMFLFTLMLGVVLLVPMPSIVAKITQFSRMTGMRGLFILSFVGMLLSIWFISYYWEKREELQLPKFVIIPVSGILAYYGMVHTAIRQYFHATDKLLTILFVMALTAAIMYGTKKLFVILMAVVIYVSGVTVNPVVQGLGAVYDKKISHDVEKIVKKDPNGVWVSETVNDFIPMLGAKELNSVNFVPDLNAWEKLDPQHKHENIYNRYSNTNVNLVHAKTNFELKAADSFTINMNVDDLSVYNVKYIFTNRDLVPLKTEKVNFTQIAEPEKAGWRIFKVDYK
jgi:hypothetical protein